MGQPAVRPHSVRRPAGWPPFGGAVRWLGTVRSEQSDPIHGRQPAHRDRRDVIVLEPVPRAADRSVFSLPLAAPSVAGPHRSAQFGRDVARIGALHSWRGLDPARLHHQTAMATQFCEGAVQQGKVLYVGSSNFAGWHIAQANEAARRRNFLGLVSEQSIYHLLRRQIETDVLPACESYGLGVIPWSPLGGGLLGGVLEKAEKGRRASAGMQTEIEKHRPKIESNYPMTDVTLTTLHTVLGWPANRAEVMPMLDGIITKAIAVDGVTGEKGIAGYTVIAPHGIAELLGRYARSDPNFIRAELRRHPRL